MGQATGNFGLAELCSTFTRHIAERSLSAVQKQLRWLCVANISPNVANGLVDMSVSDGQIQVAVEIHIEERATKAQAVLGRQADARRSRYLLIRAFFLCAVKSDHLVIKVCDAIPVVPEFMKSPSQTLITR